MSAETSPNPKGQLSIRGIGEREGADLQWVEGLVKLGHQMADAVLADDPAARRMAERFKKDFTPTVPARVAAARIG